VYLRICLVFALSFGKQKGERAMAFLEPIGFILPSLGGAETRLFPFCMHCQLMEFNLHIISNKGFQVSDTYEITYIGFLIYIYIYIYIVFETKFTSNRISYLKKKRISNYYIGFLDSLFFSTKQLRTVFNNHNLSLHLRFSSTIIIINNPRNQTQRLITEPYFLKAIKSTMI